MTAKLRRLHPQPAYLTTHEGPFLDLHGRTARLVTHDCRRPGFEFLWLLGSPIEDLVAWTDKNGIIGSEKIIFAAEEVREPRLRWVVYKSNGIFYGSFHVEEVAKREAKEIGGTYAKFVEVVETEDK